MKRKLKRNLGNLILLFSKKQEQVTEIRNTNPQAEEERKSSSKNKNWIDYLIESEGSAWGYSGVMK